MSGATRSHRLRPAGLAVGLVLLSVIAHSAAAGALPDPSGLLGAAAVSTALAVAVGTQRRSFSWLVVYFAAGQILLHVVMAAMGHHMVSFVPDSTMVLAHVLAAVAAAVLFAKSESVAAAWRKATDYLLGAPDLRLPRIARAGIVTVGFRAFLGAQRYAHLVAPTRGPPALV